LHHNVLAIALTIAVIRIDIGKNSFHVLDHDVRGAIVLIAVLAV
jgi:hypothetical protein